MFFHRMNPQNHRPVMRIQRSYGEGATGGLPVFQNAEGMDAGGPEGTEIKDLHLYINQRSR